jgi:hypothetical protein
LQGGGRLDFIFNIIIGEGDVNGGAADVGVDEDTA